MVTGVISFFTLVLGELAPKRLALQRQESISLIAAPVLDRISVLARPLVWLLSRLTNLVVRLLGGDPNVSRGVMTEEELRDLVAGTQALSADERHIVREVFDAGKRQLREVLVPRTEVEFIAASTPLERAAKIAAAAPHSRFPVYQDSYDDIIGFVHVRDLLNPDQAGRQQPVGELARPVKRLPTSKRVLSALSEMRRDRAHMAIVVDEYGGTAGIVTLEDLVEELVGEIQDEYDLEEGGPKQLLGGQLEVDGLLNLDEFAEQTGVNLPEGPYETVAGYVLASLGELPGVGAEVEVDGHQPHGDPDGRPAHRPGQGGPGGRGQPARTGWPARRGRPGGRGWPGGGGRPGGRGRPARRGWPGGRGRPGAGQEGRPPAASQLAARRAALTGASA